MKTLLHTLMLCSLFISHFAVADQLSDAGYLNKLSHSLRGIMPSNQEYAELKAAQVADQVAHFMKIKRMQYLGSSLHGDKMRARITEVFKLAPAKTVKLVNPDVEENDNRLNSTDDFITRLIMLNKSWDQLLTDSDYNLYKDFDGFNVDDSESSDLDFFTNVIPSELANQILNSTYVKPWPFQPSKEDGRFAGLLTSPRFFDRYATTGVNKNRRRAAAIFKNFLCDDMIAAIPDPSQNQSKIEDIQFPRNQSAFSEEEIRAASQMSDGLHGSQADCRSCHYKLDPMGKVFLGSPVVLSSREWPGALAYKNSKDQQVNIPVKNIKELGKAITTQEDYVSCQVRQFWNWFIGKDVFLNSETLSTLSQQFNQVDRRPNDFINLLIQREEFKTRRLEDPTQRVSRQTKEIFKKCQSCHNGKEDEITGDPLINLTLWPLGQNTTEKDPQYWLRRISKKLDLEHGGLNRSMPPPSSGWTLTREQLLLIQKWIDLGAPLEGTKQEKP